ncbi:MAG: GerMN domain-containing protein [Candidatus Onthomonas sp.]
MRRLTALLLALCLALLSGCGQSESSDQGLLLYYAARSDTGGQSAALQGEVWQDAPAQPDPGQLVNRLLQQPQNPQLEQVFPANLRLLSWTLSEGLLTLDFSEEYNGLSGISLTLANYALVLTLTQLDTVDRLTITVDGKSLPEGSGKNLSNEDLLLTGEAQDPVTLGFQLYFPLLDGEGLGTEYRESELTGTGLSDRMNAVILLLTQGPQHGDQMSSPFGGLESQLEYEMVDGVCLLTLPESWAELLSADPWARQALVNSLCELAEVDALAFDCPGSEQETLAGEFQAVYN